MTFFVGHTGFVRLRRRKIEESELEFTVKAGEVNTILNRLYFDGSEENLLTGDQVFISTRDPRGLAFFSPSAWPTSLQVRPFLRAYINVNAIGGIRFFDRFNDAVNNDRDAEIALSPNFDAPIDIAIVVRDSRFNTLGSVVSYEMNTDRGAIETTSLSDKFRQQYSAGLISGSGSIECLFSYETVLNEETPLFLLQTIQRLDVGSELGMLLSLSPTNEPRSSLFAASDNEIYYDLQAVITKAGVTVTADRLISCSIDFLTTGDLKIKVGIPTEYILKEDTDLIELEENQNTGLGFLLQEVTD